MPHRYFTRELADGRAALTGSDAHHLADVMRARIGEEVVLCGPDGLEYLGTVTAIEPGRVEFSVTDGTTSKAEPDCAVTLFAGYPKAGKLEEVIRHSVELGVTEIVPFFSRYCVATPKKEDVKNERYNRIAAEAAKQAGRAMLPHVALPLNDFAAVCKAFADFDVVLFFYEGGGAPLRREVVGEQRVDERAGARPGLRIREEPCFPPNDEGADGVLSWIVVDRQIAALEVANQARPLPMQIAQRPTEHRAGRHARQNFIEPLTQRVEHRTALALALLQALGVAQFAKAHLHRHHAGFGKAGFCAAYADAGMEIHLAAAHLAQLLGGALVGAGLGQGLAIELGHLVGADHDGAGV